jgi:hypothetical protein
MTGIHYCDIILFSTRDRVLEKTTARIDYFSYACPGEWMYFEYCLN